MASGDVRPPQLQFCTACHSGPDFQRACLPPAKSVLVKEKSNDVHKHLKGDRLAWAVHLAKRDLLQGLVHKVPSTHLESATFPSCVHAYSCPHQCRQCEGAVGKEVEVQDTRGVVCSKHGSKRITGEGDVLKGEKYGQLSGGGCVRRVEADTKSCTEEKGVKRGMEEGSMSNVRKKDELTSLKLELREQVNRLRELCMQQSELERGVLPKGEEEEDKERKKSAEHVALMVRKIYDLKRQVSKYVN